MSGPPDPAPGSVPGAEAVFARARELIVLGRGERAAALLAPLLGDGGADQLTVHNLLAHAHLVADDPGAAAEHARAVLALAPDAPGGHFLLGLSRRQLDDVAGSLEPLRQAARLDPMNPDPHGQLAVTCADLGLHEEAAAEARRAVRLAPGAAASHFAMGYALHDVDPAGAQEAYRRALELDPGHRPSQYNLALLAAEPRRARRSGRRTADAEAERSAAMVRLLAQSPSSRAPVFVLDQQIVQALGAGCAPVYFAWPMIRAAARTGDVGPAVLTVAAGLIMALCLVRGSGPVRGAVADRRSFARGFARRRWRAVVGAGLVALAWLVMLAASLGALVGGGGGARPWLEGAIVPALAGAVAMIADRRWARRRYAWLKRHGLR